MAQTETIQAYSTPALETSSNGFAALDLVRTGTKPWAATALLLCADLAALSFSIAFSVILRWRFGGDYELSLYWRLWPMLAVFVSVYWLFGLYPGIIANAVHEIQRIAAATTVLFLVLAVLTFLFRVTDTYSRLVFFIAWLCSVILVPVTRALVRKRFARSKWWGYSAVLFGTGEAARMLSKTLQDKPEIGLRIKAVMDINPPDIKTLYGVPVHGDLRQVDAIARAFDISHAIVAMPELSRTNLLALLESHASTFRNVLILPDLGGISSLGIEAKDLCRQLTLEVRRTLLQPGAQLTKRVIDCTLAAAAIVALSPLFLLIYLLLKMESRGPAFYNHTRIGRGGKTFRIWKFRSMMHDAQQVLEQHLTRHPELLEEWNRTQKLKNDPRVTRLGRILRKSSLDELPQVWNVIRGEMSLVGPRPIVDAEVPRYGAGFVLYKQVLPGITGLWQVSGRNDTSYAERVALDSYYVRNWSPWFDLYLLGRSVTIVLKGAGAY